MSGRFRIGIDVGGTFTDIVVFDATARSITGRLKIPTTHDAPAGVAAGIIEGLQRALREFAIAPAEVAFIAHSTTQATNALLEGDVAAVGVAGVLKGGLRGLQRAQMRFAPIALGGAASFAPTFTFAGEGETAARDAVARLLRQGANAVAATAAFGVDDPAAEDRIVAAARAAGLAATSGHEVASLYGLRARTRTAALNAAILPKMMETARMTAGAVSGAGIGAPLMIMRSDGGVMDVREVERRPILTMLSGPAAGIAGALLHESVTDGIFIEVGGTSADCSVIRHGLPQMRPARIGGHRTLLRTLDVRTLAIAGGSMARLRPGGVSDVGPRSAHIAGMRYACFSSSAALREASFVLVQPTARDPADYACLQCEDGTRVAITTTCAANALGCITPEMFAYGSAGAALVALEVAGRAIGIEATALARAILEAAARKVRAAIDELVLDYELDPATLVLIGGGGGCGALIPFTAQAAGLEFRIAKDAEVISPIGVALALVRDTVERTIVDPSPADILRVRREAADAAIAAGASPEGVEVAIEIDRRRNVVRATASGTTKLVEAAAARIVSAGARLAAAARTLRTPPAEVRLEAELAAFSVYSAARLVRGPFGMKRTLRQCTIVDEAGAVRAVLENALFVRGAAADADRLIRAAVESALAYGDVGRSMPDVYVLHGKRCANLSGLLEADQVAALAREELAGLSPEAPIVIAAAPTQA